MTDLYRTIASEIAKQIEQGIYKPEEKIPGVRQLSQQFNVSVSTIVHANQLLEDQGYIKPRSRSGFYVTAITLTKPKSPALSKPLSKPVLVKGQELALNLVKAANHPNILPLGAAVPHHDFLPVKAIQRSTSKIARQSYLACTSYEHPSGNLKLRQQIAKRMLIAGYQCNPEDIVITNGCQEALMLSLKVITKPGDIIAIESPAFYGLLQIIEALGLKALEIPASPEEGISLSALKQTLDKWKVKAIVVVPNFSNPLGSCLSNSNKKQLVDMANKYDVTLIEDDIYGDLSFDQSRPCALKSYDKNDNVIYCSSFSKSISPGLRVGWLLSEKYFQRIEYQKFISNISTSTVSQLVIADFLEHGGYERFLRLVRQDYRNIISKVTQAIIKHFPKGTKITQPKGGFLIWIELPKNLDAIKLYDAALNKNISIAPGPMFSSTQKYKNYFRISCAQPWNDRFQKGLFTLGKLAKSLMS